MVKISGREPRTKCNKILLSQEYDHSFLCYIYKGTFKKAVQSETLCYIYQGNLKKAVQSETPFGVLLSRGLN